MTVDYSFAFSFSDSIRGRTHYIMRKDVDERGSVPLAKGWIL